MGALRTIRSKGPLLVIVIGLALFAFLVGDAWNAIQPHRQNMHAGEVNGESLSIMDYQVMVQEEEEFEKMNNGGRSLSEEQLAQLRDRVWSLFVAEQLLSAETEKVGLAVSDEELQYVIEQGTDPLLSGFQVAVNPQTGRFDKDLLNKFLVDYTTNRNSLPAAYAQQLDVIYKQWKNIEKQLTFNLLYSKYVAMLSAAMMSNPVEAADNFNGTVNQYDALFAAMPYTSIADSLVSVSDSDLKALYDKYKDQRYKQPYEGRDIKYIEVRVVASQKDKDDLMAEMDKAAAEMAGMTDGYDAYLRGLSTTTPYVDMLRAENAFPADVKSRLETAEVNKVVGPYFNASDNTYNVFKLLDRKNETDSVLIRRVVVGAETETRTLALCDSLYDAVKGGSKLADIARDYGQSPDSMWLTSTQLAYGVVDAENAKYFTEIYSAKAGDLLKTKVGNLYVITDVMSKKGTKEKYKVAVLKRTVDFSEDTYNSEYNKFSSFIASNSTLEDLEKNAESNGYRLLESKNVLSNAHNVGGIRGSREALKWAFSAKPGDISQIYDCGDNDRMLVVAVTAEYEPGYVPMNNVRDMLMSEVLKDKKSEKIIADLKAKNITSFDGYKSLDNVISDTLKHITFSAPASVMRIGAQEPVLSGAAVKAGLNVPTAPIKGNAAVYVLDVYNQSKGGGEFDLQSEMDKASFMYGRYAGSFYADLMDRAEIKDTRYLFY